MRKPCGANLEWIGSFPAIFLPKRRKALRILKKGGITHVWKKKTETQPQRPQADSPQDLDGQKRPLAAADGVRRMAG